MMISDPPGSRVAVKIVRGYVVVYAPDHDIYLTAGKLTDPGLLRSIGVAVLNSLEQVIIRAQDERPMKLPSTLDKFKWLMMGEAADALELSHQTLRRMVERGELTTYRTSGKHRRILKSDVEALRLKRFGG